MNDLVTKAEETTEVEEAKEVRALTPMELMEQAIEKGADADQLTKLMDLQERWEKRQAEKAYTAAMSAFKADPPELYRDKHVSYEAKGQTTSYSHVSLEYAAKVIGDALLRHDLSHRWETGRDENGGTSVSCIITHAEGHSESCSLVAPADTSGGKNNVQAIGSTVTYLQRYTLLALTGLAVKGMDDDAMQLNAINEEEFEEIQELISEAGADPKKFCENFDVDAVKNLRGKDFRKARMLLKQKIKKNKEG